MTLFPPNDRFVTPRGILVDQIEENPQETPQPVPDIASTAVNILSRRPGGMCSVLYLTSNAGEGKTTLINHLAYHQAAAYRKRASDWLLVPISLGGRPFLRLDDVIAAALLNQLRTRRFYIDGFLQLVRLGYIVPALDGFEEVFVETSGDAVSSLGNLIRDTRGEGTILIAARTAYFEVKRLDRQARLLDAIPGFEVGFARLAIERWAKDEFIKYSHLSGAPDPDRLYEGLAGRVGEYHPLLTRAVFVRRIVEIAKTNTGIEFLHQIQAQARPEEYFLPFVDRILEREATEKWIDKQTKPAQPLLSLPEHHELLRLLAEEMWISKRGSLSIDMCESLSDAYCDTVHKSPAVSRQVRERLVHHPLLMSSQSGGHVAFDHDHFREFFLGEQIGFYLNADSAVDLRKIFRVDSVPGWALDIAATVATVVPRSELDRLKTVLSVAASEGPTSFVRENCGALVLRLVERTTLASLTIREISFPPDALNGRRLDGTTFANCYFRSSEVSGTLRDVTFNSCEFEHMEAADDLGFRSVSFLDCTVHGITVVRSGQSVDIYDPEMVRTYLVRSGALWSQGGQLTSEAADLPVDDLELQVMRKLLTIFSRTTQVSDWVLTTRLGVNASTFFRDVLPTLVEVGIIKELKNKGGGTQRVFRPSKPMARIAGALAESRGSFSAFLTHMRLIPANEEEMD